jgi:hypothetical protein
VLAPLKVAVPETFMFSALRAPVMIGEATVAAPIVASVMLDIVGFMLAFGGHVGLRVPSYANVSLLEVMTVKNPAPEFSFNFIVNR